jgi:hypothetical protein
MCSGIQKTINSGWATLGARRLRQGGAWEGGGGGSSLVGEAFTEHDGSFMRLMWCQSPGPWSRVRRRAERPLPTASGDDDDTEAGAQVPLVGLRLSSQGVVSWW